MRTVVHFRRPCPRAGGRKRSAVSAAIVALLLTGTVLTGCSSSSPQTAAPSSSSPHSGAASSSSSSGAGSGGAAYDEPVLKVTGAYVRQPPTADMAAAYLVVTNTGRLPGRLIGVTSNIAKSVSMHRTTAAHKMVPVKSFTVPERSRLVLRTGGNHLMLMGLKKKPTAGDRVTLRLRFADSPPITVRAPVKPMTYQPSN